MSIVFNSAQKRQHKNQNPETLATAILNSLIYGGAGPKYLGWQVADNLLLRDGTWQKLGKDGWRSWIIPTEQKPRRWWNPVWDHLKGCHRGIVGLRANSVPWVSVDSDRHDGTVLAKDHILGVLNAGRLLKGQFPQLYWPVAEINDKNGSAKLFGFTGKAIPIDIAVDLATRIHDFLLEHGIGDLEVFPFNCKQVGLPMRIDKTTIVSSGVLGKCLRKKKVDGKFVQFETYSAAAFLEAIRFHSHYDEGTLHRVIKAACANLPDLHVPERVTVSVPKIEANENNGEAVQPAKVQGDYHDEPNSLTRQLGALLELARRLHRVPTEQDALSFIKMNRLYSGDWSENENRRRDRVWWIISHIAKTFDPARCTGAKYKVNFGKFDSWARTHVGTLREKVHRYVDEYGDVHEHRGRAVVDWRFVSVMLSILEFCFDHPNADQSLPEDRAREIWESSLLAKIINVKWNNRKWAISRDWLDDLGPYGFRIDNLLSMRLRGDL